MVGYEREKDRLATLGAAVVAASGDAVDEAQEVAREVSYAVAYGVTHDDAARIGAWWSEQRGGIVQPTEFIIGSDGKVVLSTYSSGPVGRMAAGDVCSLLEFYETRRRG